MRSILLVLGLTTAVAASPRAHRAPTAYETFRAARAQCKHGGPALDALVSRYWDPEWARSFVNYKSATDAQRAEFDRVADAVFGAEERARSVRLICDYRVTDRRVVADDPDAKPSYEITVRDDRCAREEAPNLPCWCVHDLRFERVDDAWFYIDDAKLCGVRSWANYRRRLGLPGDYARYGQITNIDAAIDKLRAASSK